jgi:hypothetical protein
MIAIGVASSGRPVDLRWSLSLPQLAPPVGMSVIWLAKKSLDRAANREIIAEAAINMKAPLLFFLDDDTICPNFTLRYLHDAIERDPSTMVCGGIYCSKTDPPAPLVFKVIGGGPFYRWKVGEVFECAGLGAGAMLIKTEVFSRLQKPWFKEPDETSADETIVLGGTSVTRARLSGTDDLYFCKKVTDAGFKIMAHGGVLPVHLDQDGKMYTLPMDSYPCQGAGLSPMPAQEVKS